MKAIEKAQLFNDTFKSGSIVIEKFYQLEIDFSSINRWLTNEEETFLQMLGAVNVFSINLMDGAYTDNLNTACAGVGCFKFDDDDEKETFPIPVPLELVY